MTLCFCQGQISKTYWTRGMILLLNSTTIRQKLCDYETKFNRHMFLQWPWEKVKVKCISVDRSLDAQSLLFWQCLHCTILPICGMVSRPPIHCDLGGLVKVKVAKVKLEPKTYVYPIDEPFWWKKVHKIQQYHWKIDLTVITAVTAIFQY